MQHTLPTEDDFYLIAPDTILYSLTLSFSFFDFALARRLRSRLPFPGRDVIDDVLDFPHCSSLIAPLFWLLNLGFDLNTRCHPHGDAQLLAA
jgi:hypothetical protein